MKFLSLIFLTSFVLMLNSCGKDSISISSSGPVSQNRQDIGVCQLGDLNNLSNKELMKIGLKAYDCGVSEVQVVQLFD
ncbi:MAG: hypothetical protein Fur0010_04470 [Bdellovibrio sp.]